MPPRQIPSALRRVAESAPDFLLQLLDVAEESGEVDARQLADALGLTTAALRRALAEPHALSADHVALVGEMLGVDARVIRALRRRAEPAHTPELPPAAAADPGIAALLERVLVAIEGDATGCALRTGVLDAVTEAARAAGRPLPPAAHELRVRFTRLAAARDVESASIDDVTTTHAHAVTEAYDSAALAAAAAEVIREVQRADAGYDGLFAPIADDALDRLLARFGIVAHDVFGAGAVSRFALTPALVGRHRLVRVATATPDQRRLAGRAALAHLAAGHVSECHPLSSPAGEHDARLADVVALADLVPFWLLADLRRRGRLGWRALAEHVADLAARAAGDWSADRAADRAALRVALFRAHDL